MKWIHIADVHIGMSPNAGEKLEGQRKQEIMDSFMRIIDICNSEQIELLLIAGDLFHRQPLLRELKEVNYAFSKLNYTKVFLIAGNHDYIGEKSHYQGFKWVEQVYFLDSKELTSIYLKQWNVEIHGFSYHTRDITKPLLTGISANKDGHIHILLAHGGDDRNLPLDKKELLRSGFDYIALGHIHKPELFGNLMAYSGSLEPLDKNETGERGYVLGECTIKENISGVDEKITNITFVPFAAREYHHLTIEVESTMTELEIIEECKKQIEMIGSQNIYKIILQGLLDTDLKLSSDRFYELGNIVEFVNNTIPDYDFATLYHENKDNIIGMFINNIRYSGEEDDVADRALYYGIEALLGAKE